MGERAERLARGDREAFAELYDACADRVHRYLVGRLGTRSDADDVLQETFVRLARTRKKLADVENLTAYVFATARTRRSASSNGSAVRTDFEPHRWPRRSSRKPARATFRRESAEWIVISLARLAPELREVVELKIYAGLTFREISEVTGMPQGTAATRYRSALETMRGRMAKEME